ncbi:MAG: hypothetical protein OEW37_03805 [Rhodospirillaceae bacterium]|nr:hypothetical protein [Rhodospirillaceae bacterium]
MNTPKISHGYFTDFLSAKARPERNYSNKFNGEPCGDIRWKPANKGG